MNEEDVKDYAMLTVLVMFFIIAALVITFQLFMGWILSIIMGLCFLVGIYYAAIYMLTDDKTTKNIKKGNSKPH